MKQLSFKDLIRKLEFDQNVGLNVAMYNHMEVARECAKYRARTHALALRADDVFNAKVAAIADSHRARVSARGGKIVETAIKHALTQDPEYLDAAATRAKAEAAQERGKILIDLLRHRRDVLRMLVDLGRDEDKETLSRVLAKKYPGKEQK